MIVYLLTQLAWVVAFWAGVLALAAMPRHLRLWLLGLATLPAIGLVMAFGFSGFAGLLAAIVAFGYCLYPTYGETARGD
jgi:hypothetical protein